MVATDVAPARARLFLRKRVKIKGFWLFARAFRTQFRPCPVLAAHGSNMEDPVPIYAYRCESCGFQKDALQKLSDAPLTVCPECGQPTFKKQVTAAGFQLKGSGWYVTDFRDGGSKAKAKPESADAAGKSDKPADTSGPAAATDSAKPAGTSSDKPSAASGKESSSAASSASAAPSSPSGSAASSSSGSSGAGSGSSSGSSSSSSGGSKTPGASS
jgi:putative FmdB family regulatory protein